MIIGIYHVVQYKLIVRSIIESMLINSFNDVMDLVHNRCMNLVC